MRGTGRLSTAVVAAGLALALLGSACADSGGEGDGGNAGAGGDSTGVTGSTGGSGGGGRYGTGYGAGGSTGSTGSSGGGVLTVTQVNYQFTPAKVTVTQGDTITVKDTNPSTPHTFTVTGTDIDVANDPMESQDVAIDLDPGTYDFVCRFHEGQGMTGTLTVE